jgi:hypothetical protein
MNVNITIDRLILEGISLQPDQRPVLQAAVETELARLVATAGLSPDLAVGGVLASLPAGQIQLTSEGSPRLLGQQIARAVYGGIGG